MIIAIDGPSASGKGTLGRLLAFRYGFHYLDTGLLYRRVGQKLLCFGHSLTDESLALRAAQELDFVLPDDPALRSREMGNAASIVAAIPCVRAELNDFQRLFSLRKPGTVLDGRDIGTLICPDASVKLFVTASIKVRAFRRFQELREREEEVTQDVVLDDLERRDQCDAVRAVSPLRVAPGATVLDTTTADIDSVLDSAVCVVEAALALDGLRG
ncbi:MAG: (d)CMP kinase [Alphaproteobacteria bacterium]|nr:(d)CMP kinase [Alphaproteobacteria bacterium]